MAVNIDEFKRDLEQLKNQRSVIQAKLDEANRHVTELTETLKGMGFNSVDEAKQAYVKQQTEAEAQHELVKKLIHEISNVDTSIPTREDVMAKLNALSVGDFNISQVQAQPEVQQVKIEVETPVIDTTAVNMTSVPVQSVPTGNDFIQQNVIPPVSNPISNPVPQEGSVNLSDMLFASL